MTHVNTLIGAINVDVINADGDVYVFVAKIDEIVIEGVVIGVLAIKDVVKDVFADVVEEDGFKFLDYRQNK